MNSFNNHLSNPQLDTRPSQPFPPISLPALIPDAPQSVDLRSFTDMNGNRINDPESASHSSTDDQPKEEHDLEKHEVEPAEEPEKHGELPPPHQDQPGDARPPLQQTHTKNSVNNVSSIPNGGVRAWLQVLGAWSLFFNSWGIINTFGAYQTFYEGGTLFQSSSSTISWIGAVQAFLLMLVGALTGPIYDAGYFRALLLVGSFLIVLGQMMLSICHEYYQVFLAQAVCIGVGAGCLFVPSVAIMSTYFSTRIALAIGISASGSSIGGVIYPIVFHKLQPTLGFGWATRIIGFMELALLLIPISVMKVRVLPPAKRKLLDLKAFTELPYLLYTVGAMIGFAGLYVPFFYLQYYAITERITDENLGFYLLAVLNGASVFGRILPNLIADRFGGMNVLIPCAFATTLLIFCLLAAFNVPSVILIALFYGFFSGTFVSLPPSIYVTLSPNRGLIGTRMGMGFSVISIGVLVGTPIAGAILGPENNFRGIWLFSGFLTLAGTLLFVAARIAKYGTSLKVKA